MFIGQHKDGNRMNIAQCCPPTRQYVAQYIMSIKRQFDTICHTTFNIKSRRSIILCNNYNAQYFWPSMVPLPVSSQPQLAGLSLGSKNPVHAIFLTTRNILPSTRESPGFPTKNQYVILTLMCPPGSLSYCKVQTMKPHSYAFLQPPVQILTFLRASSSLTPMIYYCTHLKMQFFLDVKPRRLVKSSTLRRSLEPQS